MLAYLHEVGQNHSLVSEGVFVHNNSWDREGYFLRVAASSNPRINKILNPLRQILCEAADRFDFRTPFHNIKQLKVKRTDVDPFSLEEVKTIINTVRADFKQYFTVRFFTGMRTGEVHGLKWKNVDFEGRLLMVRETIVDGEEGDPKTYSSRRDIHMSQLVYDALKVREIRTLIPRPVNDTSAMSSNAGGDAHARRTDAHAWDNTNPWRTHTQCDRSGGPRHTAIWHADGLAINHGTG
jgi:integrase